MLAPLWPSLYLPFAGPERPTPPGGTEEPRGSLQSVATDGCL
jgi:hypothetical protein